MTKEIKVADVWVYNTCIVGKDAYLLLGERKNYESRFWHVASQGIFQTKPQPLTSEMIIQTAHIANANELALDSKDLNAQVVYIDLTASSSWAEGIQAGHVWIDHGKVDQVPCVIPTVYEPVPNATKGMTHAEWVKVSDILVTPIEERNIAESVRDVAASVITSFNGKALRSKVSSVLAGNIIPLMLKGQRSPAAREDNLLGNLIRAANEPERLKL